MPYLYYRTLLSNFLQQNISLLHKNVLHPFVMTYISHKIIIWAGCSNTSSMCQMEGNLNTRTCSECSCPLGFGGVVCETNVWKPKYYTLKILLSSQLHLFVRRFPKLFRYLIIFSISNVHDSFLQLILYELSFLHRYRPTKDKLWRPQTNGKISFSQWLDLQPSTLRERMHLIRLSLSYVFFLL